MRTTSRRRGAQKVNLQIRFRPNPWFPKIIEMINWIKNRLSRAATADEPEDTPDEFEENFGPVSVRVNPPVAVKLKPADTYIEGYNVHEVRIDADADHSTTVNDIKTTGVDPYNTGRLDLSVVDKSDPE